MKKKALLFLFLSVPVFIFGQESLEEEKVKRPLDLRFNLLGLLDVLDHNVSFGLESRRTGKVSVVMEMGWIFHSGYLAMSQKTNGLILRPAVRYYPNPEKNGFIEMELHYKSVLYSIDDWIGRECSDNIPSYDERTTFQFRKQAYGFHIRAGMKGALDVEKRFWVEFNSGLGLRWKKQGLHKEPGSCYNGGAGLFDLNPSQNQARPVLPLTLRVIYRIQ